MGPDRNMGLSVSGRHGVGGEVLPTATTTQKGTPPEEEEQRGNNKQLPPPQQQDLPAYLLHALWKTDPYSDTAPRIPKFSK